MLAPLKAWLRDRCYKSGFPCNKKIVIQINTLCLHANINSFANINESSKIKNLLPGQFQTHMFIIWCAQSVIFFFISFFFCISGYKSKNMFVFVVLSDAAIVAVTEFFFSPACILFFLHHFLMYNNCNWCWIEWICFWALWICILRNFSPSFPLSWLTIIVQDPRFRLHLWMNQCLCTRLDFVDSTVAIYRHHLHRSNVQILLCDVLTA